jgi:DNA-binding response OmpR family regulator
LPTRKRASVRGILNYELEGETMTELLKDKTVMVMADDANIRDLLRRVLEEASADVVTADSVESAFETYRQSPPHAVVTDLWLGASDGYALIKAIRETDLEYRGSTVVVALTGSASPEEQKRALAAGFDTYIAKPFDPVDVVETLRELLSHPRESAADSGPAQP